MNIFDVTHDFIEKSIKTGIDFKKSQYFKNPIKFESARDNYFHSDKSLKSMYFSGKFLFLDSRTTKSENNIITLSYNNEDFGLYSGGIRRLLSIKELRLFRELMDLCDINYKDKILI